MEDLKRFLSVDLLTNVFAEFQWPLPYVLIDDLPDGIILSFPKSNFVFSEGSEGVHLSFLLEDTGYAGLTLGDALAVLAPNEKSPPLDTANIENEWCWPYPSEGRTRKGVRDLCEEILAHLQSVIAGDFSWVREARKGRPVVRPRGGGAE